MNTDEKLSKGALSKDSKKLVVFFSHTGENYNVGNIEKGNTHIIADMIADASGADIFEIVPEKDYPHDDYNECIEIAKKVENFPSLPYILNVPHKNMFAKCPVGRPGTADEVANVAELLMRPQGSFITGADFLIDGDATASYFYGSLQPK